jgi:hypothetical protein
MTAAQETYQLVGPRKKCGGPSDLVQHCVVQRGSPLCAAACVLRSRLRARTGSATSHAEPHVQVPSSSDRSLQGGSDAPRAHATRVNNDHLNPTTRMGVVHYSDVHQDSQHEVWNFVRENFFKRVRQGYTKDKASEFAV